MNSGYIGFSRSVRSQEARNEGKMTATDFAKWARRFKMFSGCVAGDVSAVLDACEWHHTSKRFNRTNYYDPRDLLCVDVRRALADRIATRKASKNGSLADMFAVEAAARGLTIVAPHEGSIVLHAVNEAGIVCGLCYTADDPLWKIKCGMRWY